MSTFKSNITGMKAVLDRIEKYDKALKQDLVQVLDEGAVSISDRARASAPQGLTGRLKASISADVSAPYSKVISADIYYAAFVEFGTGSMVFDNDAGFSFTPEMKEFAKEFYVNGKGRMPAQPYMFPALEEGKRQIIERVKKLFDL